jgi:cysteine desulfurase family protein (TIGR01976 family)
MSFDLEAIRAQFPALALTDNGTRRIYFDNPAGTQVPLRVAEAMSDCLLNTNANLGGYFATSQEAGRVEQSARDAMADFLNAPSSDEIVFGQTMTALTLHLSRSIGKTLRAGDEVLVSRMDHDANVWPWVMMAEDLGLEVRWLPFNTDTFEFDMDVVEQSISKRTKLVCIGGASNLTGTLNDVKSICSKAKAVGALAFVDGVQSAPHVPVDVQDIGCDFFVCSSYKFFGPHQGILWGRREVLERLEPYKLRPAPEELPWRFESGTQSHEGMAGITAAVEYFATIGATMAASHADNWMHFDGRRRDVHAAIDMLFDYEKSLAERLIDGLMSIDGIKVQGVTDKEAMDRRVPTVSFTHQSKQPNEIAAALAQQGIFVWSGHNYAVEVAKALNIYDTGGAVRVGPVHYNSLAEIDELLEVLHNIVSV